MSNPKWRRRLAQLGSVGAAALTVSLLVTSGSASALTVPSGYPRWFIGSPQMIRDAGSDTTFFMMQKLSDLFEQAGLYGCQLSKTPAPNYSTCNTGGDISTTDKTDNYDRIEVTTGVDQIGSGEGQNQLCGVDSSPFPVDFSRSSKPPGVCPTLVGAGYAKDAVPSIDFPTLEGNGVATGSSFGSQIVGPVAAGWLPGDATTCDQGAAGTNGVNACSGTPFFDLPNTGGTSSVAYRLYCATDSTRITDWGQLTNLSGGKTVGNGTAVNVPITIIGVNPASGTESTFQKFVDSGTGLCPGNTNTNQSALMGGSQALENDAAQIPDFATAPGIFGSDSGTTLTADQDAFVQTSLYYMSNGVYQSNTYARAAAINGLNATGFKMTENSTPASQSNIMSNAYPTARVLYNVYNTNTLRASVADFLNWICGTNTDGVFTKAKDLSTGKNYDTEITSVIQNTFGFFRLTDTTVAPNNTCQLINVAPAVTDGVENGTTTISSATGFAQAGKTPVRVGDLVTGAGIPANTYVSSITDANDIVLNQAATQSANGVTITFNIHSPTT